MADLVSVALSWLGIAAATLALILTRMAFANTVPRASLGRRNDLRILAGSFAAGAGHLSCRPLRVSIWPFCSRDRGR
jgi:hypothetical protein